MYNVLIETDIPVNRIRLIKMCLCANSGIVRICKYLSYTFPIEKCLKKIRSIKTIALDFAIQYAITAVRANQEGFNFKSTHQLPISADNISMVGESIYTEKKNTEVSLIAIRETDLDVNVYTFRARKQKGGKYQKIKIVNKSFERAKQFRDLVAT